MGAQSTVPGPLRMLDAATVQQIVDSVTTLVARHYVVPDTGTLIAAYLRNQVRQNAYTRALDRAQLVDFLSADMQKVNGDRQLYLRAADAGGGGTPVMARRGAMAASALTAARRENFNIDRADRLEGNAGYLSFSLVSSMGGEEALRVLDAAMASLDRTDAMIIEPIRRPR